MKHHPDTIYDVPEKLRATRSGFLTTKHIAKPWGGEELLVLTHRYVAKILTINPGHRLSVQYHRRKLETLLCVDGNGWVHLGTRAAPHRLRKRAFRRGMVLHLTPGTVHTFEATRKMRLFEVSTPEVWDVVRIVDQYGRSTPKRRGAR